VRGATGPDYFIIGTGRIELYDDHAIFRPDGSPQVVSVMAPIEDANANANAADPGLPPPPTNVPPPPPAPAPTPIPNPVVSVSQSASTLTMIAAIVSLLLAIYLFVIAIMTLRASRKGSKLHWVYIVLKVPLVVLAAAAQLWMVRGLEAGMNAAAAATAANTGATGGPSTPGSSFATVMMTWIILVACAALAYPISLVFVLLSKTVRDYYKPAAA
jgi:hypothetical protein